MNFFFMWKRKILDIFFFFSYSSFMVYLNFLQEIFLLFFLIQCLPSRQLKPVYNTTHTRTYFACVPRNIYFIFQAIGITCKRHSTIKILSQNSTQTHRQLKYGGQGTASSFHLHFIQTFVAGRCFIYDKINGFIGKGSYV